MRLAVVLEDVAVAEEPRILSFAQHAPVITAGRIQPAQQRARAELRNCSCPLCNRVTVEPVELRDGRLGRNGRIVPGTGTLVGFSCQACGHEWPC